MRPSEKRRTYIQVAILGDLDVKLLNGLLRIVHAWTINVGP